MNKKNQTEPKKKGLKQNRPKLKVRSGVRAGYYIGITLSAGGGNGNQEAA